MPFGMELDIFFVTTGFMILDGWKDYACKARLLDTFGRSSGLLLALKARIAGGACGQRPKRRVRLRRSFEWRSGAMLMGHLLKSPDFWNRDRTTEGLDW